jgi:hypothetical protein
MGNDKISLYLDEIAEHLWSDHACVMVGAGFGKNASTKFLSWKELGDVFYNKLHGDNSTGSDKAYLDVLKLADEIEATFGKSKLNDLLKKTLPDKEFQPSKLHKQLLALPWKDVFTTNYDTLLERAADTIVDRKYDVVINKEDLILSSSPRIIKLHGSFPSERPFIISGEDYRLYPTENAPFVNTVQQSLLENILCLIGFSGDDPNFLKWIGWIRDNLGEKNCPKIYLIGASPLSCGEQKLLENRNIISIDLSYSNGSKNDHGKAIEFFIDRMNQYQNERRNIKYWGDSYKSITQDNCTAELLSEWTKERESYPGWLILPATKRYNIYNSICRVSIIDNDSFKQLETPYDLLFLYEYNWRIEKSLFPIMNDWVPIYESVLNKYDPFNRKISNSENSSKEENNPIDWNIIQKAWISLQLSLLRLFREEGWNDKWNNLADILIKAEKYFSEEEKARFNYEKCLHYLFVFDIDEFKNCIKNWDVDMSLPYWAAKRATLLVEFDSTNEAVIILEQCLKNVRNRLNLVPIRNDYSLVSLESYLMLLYRLILPSYKISHGDYNFESLPDYEQRWNVLKQYQCDPWGEIDNFNTQISSNLQFIKDKKRYATFDIGQKRIIYNISGNSEILRLSWGYFKFIEETGIPYMIPSVQVLNKETLHNALFFISHSSPVVSILAMIRSRDKENVEYVYNRKTLSAMNPDLINEQASGYIRLLELVCLKRQPAKDNITITFSTILPEIISRFCCRISFDLKERLIDILISIYKFGNMNTDYDMLMKRLIESFTIQEQYYLIPKLLNFPVADLGNEGNDPFLYIKVSKNKFDRIDIEYKIVEDLLSKLLVDDLYRTIVIARLYFLMKYGLLSESQKISFGNNLWKIKNEDGFPKQRILLNSAFLNFPHPKDILPVRLLKKYIDKTSWDVDTRNINIIKGKKYETSLSITHGHIPILEEIIGTNKYKDQYQWTKKEINSLTEKIVNWWNLNKHYLNDKEEFLGFKVAREFELRFTRIKEIIVSVIADNFTDINTKNAARLKEVIEDIPNFDIRTLHIKAALYCFDPIEFSKIEKDIAQALSSNSENKISDAISAILTFADKKYDEIIQTIDIVSNNLRCCKSEGLICCLHCLTIIIRKHPEYISNTTLQNIELGLNYLKDYTLIDESDDDITVDHKMLYKQEIAKLLPVLDAYYKVKNLNVTSVANDWIKIVTDENEFSDIRNAYIKALKN